MIIIFSKLTWHLNQNEISIFPHLSWASPKAFIYNHNCPHKSGLNSILRDAETNTMSDEQFYKELQGDFYKESLDLIERFESVLLNNETINNENINELFRIAHTIKGGSAAVGLPEMSSYTHKVEDFLSQYKNKCELFSKPIISLFLEFSDLLRVEFIAQLSGLESNWDPSIHIEKLRNFNEEHAALTGPVEPKVIFSNEEIAQLLEDRNSLELDPRLEQENPQQSVIANANVPNAKINTSLAISQPPSQKVKKNNIQVKVDNDRLDMIFNTIGEVVVVKNQMKEHLLKNLNDAASLGLSESLDFIIKDLYDKALGLRLTSIQPLLQRLQRTLRDLSLQLNKSVHVTIFGEDTEIDRTLFDALGEPLIHIIRNAIDHGIETNEDRILKNKVEKAHIQIKAYYLSGQVVIEINDNGRGIDAEKVFIKCKMKELIPETAKFSDYSEEQIQNLILLPGFSTAEAISDISGRGVGLDVVKTTVEKMMGKLVIKSKKDVGTTFFLYLPMTTSLIDGIVFEVNKSKFIVPVSAIKSIIQITKENLTFSPCGEIYLNHLQKPVPVINLNTFLIAGIQRESKENYVVVISEINGLQTAFLFDEVLNQAQAVVKPLCDVQKRSEYIGAAVLGDGFTYLILDLNSIQLNYFQKNALLESKYLSKKDMAA